MRHDNDNEKLPDSRSEAKKTGSTRYFNGKPCPQGHVAPRMTSNGACVTCQSEKTRKYLRDRWATDPEWRLEKSAKERERRRQPDVQERDRPKNAAQARRRRRENPELAERERAKCREYWHKVRKHSAEAREAKVVHHRNRRSLETGNEGTHTAQDIRDILARQAFKCAECGTSVKSKSKRHVDHITPLSRGGSNWPSNLQVLCAACNLSKGAKDPIDWAQSKGRLL